MPHQYGFGDNGPETTGLSKPDDGDDCMQKKSENVAHPPDGIKLKKPQEFSALAEFGYHRPGLLFCFGENNNRYLR